MPLPLIPATLLPGETTYPADLQTLVNRLAATLYTPEQPRDFYRHTSPDQAPDEALWLDQRSGALKAKNASSVWQTILSGNFNYVVYPNNAIIPSGTSGTNLFDANLAPAADDGVEVASLTSKPYIAGNKMLVIAHVPMVASSESDVTVYGILVCGSSVFGVSTATTRFGEMQSLLVLGIHTPSVAELTNGTVTYKLRLGTDDSDAQVYYNRKSPNDVFQNFMKITMLSLEIPSV
jgi:hypothetical protein